MTKNNSNGLIKHEKGCSTTDEVLAATLLLFGYHFMCVGFLDDEEKIIEYNFCNSDQDKKRLERILYAFEYGKLRICPQSYDLSLKQLKARKYAYYQDVYDLKECIMESEEIENFGRSSV